MHEAPKTTRNQGSQIERREYLPLVRRQPSEKYESSRSSLLLPPLSSPRLSEIEPLRAGKESQNHLTYTMLYIFIISILLYSNITLPTYEEVCLAHLSRDLRAQQWFEVHSQLLPHCGQEHNEHMCRSKHLIMCENRKTRTKNG